MPPTSAHLHADTMKTSVQTRLAELWTSFPVEVSETWNSACWERLRFTGREVWSQKKEKNPQPEGGGCSLFTPVSANLLQVFFSFYSCPLFSVCEFSISQLHETWNIPSAWLTSALSTGLTQTLTISQISGIHSLSSLRKNLRKLLLWCSWQLAEAKKK